MQETCSKHSGPHARSRGRHAPPQAAGAPGGQEVYTPWQQLGHLSLGQKAPKSVLTAKQPCGQANRTSMRS